MASLTRARLRRSGRALAIALPALGVVTLSVLVIAPRPSKALPDTALSFEDRAPRSVLVRADLARVGLDAEVFAAAGYEPGTVSQIIRALSIESDFGFDRVRDADRAFRAARSELESLERLIRSGGASREEVESIGDVRRSVRIAEASLDAARGGVLDFVTSAAPPERAMALRTILSQREAGVEVPYAATELTATDSVRLRDALSMERYALARDLAIDDETAGFLAEIRSRPEVAWASEGLVRLEEVRSSFESAVFALDG